MKLSGMWLYVFEIVKQFEIFPGAIKFQQNILSISEAYYVYAS